MPQNPRSLTEVDFRPRGSVFPSPAEWRDQFIYFLLVDRFNKDGNNAPPYDPGTTPTGRDDAEGERWQHGTIKGVTERLDYIKGLGCTAVWLSPVFKNRKESDSYHGYGIQGFLDVDSRFGSIGELRELVDAAHSRGMYVILDIIINHTGDNWAYPGGHPYRYNNGETFDFGFWREYDPAAGLQWPDDGVWPAEFQELDWYRRKGEIQNWNAFPEARDGDFCSLKELNTSDRDTLKALIDVYKYWIAVADIDGYRLDTVKHVEDSNVAIFCSAIREYAQKIGKKNFFIFGEVVGTDREIDNYLGRNARNPDNNERFPSLDAALDFPLWGVLEWVIKGFQNPAALRSRYDRFRELYSDHGRAGQYFVTFVDNHDQIGRSPRGRFLHNDPAKERVVLAAGYLLTSMGVPCIYYGTEQGFDGGGGSDKYIRECMFGGRWGAFDTTGHHFFNTENNIYRKISRIAEIRKSEPAMRYGRQYFREISGNGIEFGHPIDGRCVLAYSRILDDTEVLVAMNLDSAGRSDYVTVDKNLTRKGGRMKNLLNGSEVEVEERGMRNAVKTNLAPHEIAIYKLK